MTIMAEWRISRLRPDPTNKELFDDLTGEEFNNLVRSITAIGQINPITVTPTGLIIAGHQRYRALKKAGVETALVVVREIQDDDTKAKEIVRLDEQLWRRELGRAATVAAIQRWSELNDIRHGSHGSKSPMTIIGLAELMGKSVDTVLKLKRLGKLIPPFMSLYDSERMTFVMAYQLAQLPAEEQEKLVPLVTEQIETLEVKSVKDYRKQVEEKNKRITELQKELDERAASPVPPSAADEEANLLSLEEMDRLLSAKDEAIKKLEGKVMPLEEIVNEQAAKISEQEEKIAHQTEVVSELTGEVNAQRAAKVEAERVLSFENNDRVHRWLQHSYYTLVDVDPAEYVDGLRDELFFQLLFEHELETARMIQTWIGRYVDLLEADRDSPRALRRLK